MDKFFKTLSLIYDLAGYCVKIFFYTAIGNEQEAQKWTKYYQMKVEQVL